MGDDGPVHLELKIGLGAREIGPDAVGVGHNCAVGIVAERRQVGRVVASPRRIVEYQRARGRVRGRAVVGRDGAVAQAQRRRPVGGVDRHRLAHRQRELVGLPGEISPLSAGVTELTKAGPTCRVVVKLAAAERSAALPLGSLIVAPLRLTWAI